MAIVLPLFALAALPSLAAPVRRALLVGVSNYPAESVGDLQLEGPKNDVALMLDTLPQLGVSDANLTVLADGLEKTGATRKADGMPTRKAILDALAKLAADSAPGDFALIYLSGHGSRQPDLNPQKRAVPKPEGLDETFLPIDIGVWDDGIAAVQNAILDFEVGQAVKAIRARGADVWIVIDACHSGAMTRSAVNPTAGDGVVKQVAPDRLKIPAEAFAKARALAAARAPAGATRSAGPQPKPRSEWSADSAAPAQGSYAAFFAAYPDQAALQKALPRYGGEASRPRGVLTYYMAQALRAGRVTTYRDLAHQVMAAYEDFGAKAPTPMFEGDLNAALPGASGPRIRRYVARREGQGLSLSAGAVDGVNIGAVVALARADAPENVIAHARVETAGVSRAVLSLAAHAGRETALADIPDDTALLARVVEPGVELRFRVARPPEDADGKATMALDDIAAKANAPVELVAAGAPADVYLRVEDGALWLLPASGRFEKTGRERTPSLPLAGMTQTAARRAIEERLGELARARNLTRVAGAMDAAAMAQKLKIEGFLAREDRKAAPGAQAADDVACGPMAEDRVPEGAAPLALDAPAPPELKHCDQLYFRLTNLGDAPIDITPLYIDGDGRIAYLGPDVGIRLEPKAEPTVVRTRIVTWSQRQRAPLAIGAERLLVIAVEMQGREALAADFRYLAGARGATRSAGGAPKALRDVLEAAAFPGATRSASAPATLGGGAAGVADFRWRVVAPE